MKPSYSKECNFQKDFNRAKPFEDEIIKYLTVAYTNPLNTPKDKYHHPIDVRMDKEFQKQDIDILLFSPLNNKSITLEIKIDSHANSNNLCIETANATNDNGWINKSKASAFLFVFPKRHEKTKEVTGYQMYFVQGDKLREAYEAHKSSNNKLFRCFDIRYKNGGAGFLIPKDYAPLNIKEHYISKDDLNTLINSSHSKAVIAENNIQKQENLATFREKQIQKYKSNLVLKMPVFYKIKPPKIEKNPSFCLSM
jgi:hypothetical protein